MTNNCYEKTYPNSAFLRSTRIFVVNLIVLTVFHIYYDLRQALISSAGVDRGMTGRNLIICICNTKNSLIASFRDVLAKVFNWFYRVAVLNMRFECFLKEAANTAQSTCYQPKRFYFSVFMLRFCHRFGVRVDDTEAIRQFLWLFQLNKYLTWWFLIVNAARAMNHICC